MKKLNIEGFTLAKKHGVTLKVGDAEIYTDEAGNLIKVSRPTIQPIQEGQKYPQFSFKIPGQAANHKMHQVVASTFLGSRDEWIVNEAPPPKALTDAEGKREAQKLWKETHPKVKIAIAGGFVDIDHIDDDRNNYNLDNLQYMYKAENNAKTPGGKKKG